MVSVVWRCGVVVGYCCCGVVWWFGVVSVVWLVCCVGSNGLW